MNRAAVRPAVEAEAEVEAEAAARLRRRWPPETLVCAALLGLVVLFGVLEPDSFLTESNLRNLARDAALLLILATGQTYVIITGGLDLSVGPVLVLSNVLATKVMDGRNETPVLLLGLVVCVAVGALAGLCNGLVVTKGRLSPVIVTLATLSIVNGINFLLTDGVNLRNVPTRLTRELGAGELGGIPAVFLVGVAVCVVGGTILRTTVFGRHIYAVGSSRTASLRAGVPVDRRVASAYVLSGALAGLAGYLAIARFATTAVSGHTSDSLKSITAVALGGTSLFGGVGSVLGSAIGVFIPAVLQNGLVITGTQPYWQDVITGAVLIGAVLLDRRRRQSPI